MVELVVQFAGDACNNQPAALELVLPCRSLARAVEALQNPFAGRSHHSWKVVEVVERNVMWAAANIVELGVIEVFVYVQFQSSKVGIGVWSKFHHGPSQFVASIMSI